MSRYCWTPSCVCVCVEVLPGHDTSDRVQLDCKPCGRVQADWNACVIAALLSCMHAGGTQSPLSMPCV